MATGIRKQHTAPAGRPSRGANPIELPEGMWERIAKKAAFLREALRVTQPEHDIAAEARIDAHRRSRLRSVIGNCLRISTVIRTIARNH